MACPRLGFPVEDLPRLAAWGQAQLLCDQHFAPAPQSK